MSEMATPVTGVTGDLYTTFQLSVAFHSELYEAKQHKRTDIGMLTS